MKRKKFLALALAGVMTAVTLTACAPLETLYDWFFGGGSGSASRGNGVNLVELNDNDYNGLKSQIMGWFGLNEADVFTDRSRTALEEVVGKLNADTMMDPMNKLNAKGQNELNNVAKSQLPWESGMCIDVMKLSPTSADAVRRSRRTERSTGLSILMAMAAPSVRALRKQSRARPRKRAARPIRAS